VVGCIFSDEVGDMGRIDWAVMRDAMRHGDPRPLEWYFASFKIVWGLWLLMPMHTFSVSPHLYRYVALMPEWVYGLVWVVLGLLQFRAYLIQDQMARWRLALVGAFVWITYGTLLWWGDHRSPALVLFGVMALFKLITAYWLSPRHSGG
jgi:hypothetical protein